MKRKTARLVGAWLCIVLISSLAIAPAAAWTDEERFLVEVDGDGDAEVSMTLAYDLDDANDAAAFEALRENETVRARLSQRFENRMAAVAEDASAATGRAMSVNDTNAEFRRDSDSGLLTLSIGWTNLAAVGDNRLTVTEPFASGFEPDRPFTVVVPDGYDVVSAEPAPSASNGTSVTWASGGPLDGFEVVAEADGEKGAKETTGTAAPDEGAGTPDAGDTDDAAGFGVAATAVALLGAALLAIRR